MTCGCGNPGCGGPLDFSRTKRLIEEYGQQIVSVMDTPPFHYTIGNAEKGLAELLLIGPFEPAIAGHLLNNLGELHRGRTPLPLGENIDIGFTMPIRLHECADWVKGETTVQAGEYLGRQDYKVWQVIVPDKNGKFPGDEGAEGWVDAQVLH